MRVRNKPSATVYREELRQAGLSDEKVNLVMKASRGQSGSLSIVKMADALARHKVANAEAIIARTRGLSTEQPAAPVVEAPASGQGVGSGEPVTEGVAQG